MVTISVLITIIVLLAFTCVAFGVIASKGVKDYNEVNEERYRVTQDIDSKVKLLQESKESYNILNKKYSSLKESLLLLFISFNYGEFEDTIWKLTELQIGNFEKHDYYMKFVCWDAKVHSIDESGFVILQGKENKSSSIKFRLHHSKRDLLNYSKGDTIKVAGKIAKIERQINDRVWPKDYFIMCEVQDAFIIKEEGKKEQESQVS